MTTGEEPDSYLFPTEISDQSPGVLGAFVQRGEATVGVLQTLRHDGTQNPSTVGLCFPTLHPGELGSSLSPLEVDAGRGASESLMSRLAAQNLLTFPPLSLSTPKPRACPTPRTTPAHV